VTELRVHLPDDVAARLAAEAAQRGRSPEDLAAEMLTQRVPARRTLGFANLGRSGDARRAEATGHRFAFIGTAASGRGDISERAEEFLRDEFGA
jgi:plasmid stability protein